MLFWQVIEKIEYYTFFKNFKNHQHVSDIAVTDRS